MLSYEKVKHITISFVINWNTASASPPLCFLEIDTKKKRVAVCHHELLTGNCFPDYTLVLYGESEHVREMELTSILYPAY